MRKTKHNRKNKKHKTRNKRGGAESGCRHCPPDTCSNCYFTRGGKKYKCQYHTGKKRCAGTTGMFASLSPITDNEISESNMISVDNKDIKQREADRLKKTRKDVLLRRKENSRRRLQERQQRAAAGVDDDDDERVENQPKNDEGVKNQPKKDPLDDEIEFIEQRGLLLKQSLKDLKMKYYTPGDIEKINAALDRANRAEKEEQLRAKAKYNGWKPASTAESFSSAQSAAYRPTDLTNRYATYAEEQGGGGKKSRKNNRKKSHKNNRKKSRRK